MADVFSDFADCVATLHEAALSAERWPAALQASMRLFGASGILLTDIDTRLDSLRSIQTGGHDPELLAAYANYYEAIDPTITVGMAGAAGTVYHLRDHFSTQQMARSEYFQDFLFAFGVTDVMATPVDYAADARLFLSLQRRSGETPFDATCHPLLERFSRQLHIAKRTEAHLRIAKYNNMALAAGLDAFAAAMFVLDAKGRVIHLNVAAETLLRGSKVVCVSCNRLRLNSPNANARLQDALKGASKMPAQATLYTITATESVAPSLQLLATPLHASHDLNASWQEPLVLVIISDTRQMALTAANRMRRLYGLTAAESQLVAELADGKSLREIAELRAVTQATLRTQLLAAFSKTGVRRQVDLVRLVAALAPVAADAK